MNTDYGTAAAAMLCPNCRAKLEEEWEGLNLKPTNNPVKAARMAQNLTGAINRLCCDDCRAACTPILDGQCDADDPCGDGRRCAFGARVCLFECDPEVGCDKGSTICEPCATSSCCGCKDCVAGCVYI